MDIMIRGMEMPTNCCECPLTYDGTCIFTGIEALSIGIQKDCPLVPVPPHGDLIDRDALMNSDGDLWDGMWGWSGVQIANAPTVIKASE